MNWASGAIAVFLKDVRSELRTRTALNAIVLFALVTLFSVSFATAGLRLPPAVHASLFWIILFFAAMAGLSRTFVVEAERGTELALRLTAGAFQVYAGKLLFNLALLGLLALVLVPAFQILLPFEGARWDTLLVGLMLGGLALAASSTLIAAIVSQAGVKGALFSVLALPVLVPVLFAGVGSSRRALAGEGWQASLGEYQILIAYAGIMITLAWLLMDHIWQE